MSLHPTDSWPGVEDRNLWLDFGRRIEITGEGNKSDLGFYRIRYKSGSGSVDRALMLNEAPVGGKRVVSSLVVDLADGKHARIYGGATPFDSYLPRSANVKEITPREFTVLLTTILHESYVPKSDVAEVLSNMGIGRTGNRQS